MYYIHPKINFLIICLFLFSKPSITVEPINEIRSGSDLTKPSQIVMDANEKIKEEEHNGKIDSNNIVNEKKKGRKKMDDLKNDEDDDDFDISHEDNEELYEAEQQEVDKFLEDFENSLYEIIENEDANVDVEDDYDDNTNYDNEEHFLSHFEENIAKFFEQIRKSINSNYENSTINIQFKTPELIGEFNHYYFNDFNFKNPNIPPSDTTDNVKKRIDVKEINVFTQKEFNNKFGITVVGTSEKNHSQIYGSKSSQIVSKIINIDPKANISKIVTSYILDGNEKPSEYKCSRFKAQRHKYVQQGCSTKYDTINGSKIIQCTCMKGFSFGLLFNPYQQTVEYSFSKTIISMIGSFCTIIFGLATILIFLLSKIHRKSAIRNLQLNLTISIVLVNISFVFLYYVPDKSTACKYGSILMNYSLITMFLVIFTVGLDLLIKLYKNVAGITIMKLKYMIIPWLLSFLIVLIFKFASPDSFKNTKPCFPSGYAFYIGSIGLGSLVLAINSVVTVILIVKKVKSQQLSKNSNNNMLSTIILASFLLGLPWLLCLAAYGPIAEVIEWTFLTIMFLQGFFLIYFFVIRQTEAHTKMTFVKLLQSTLTISRVSKGSTDNTGKKISDIKV